MKHLLLVEDDDRIAREIIDNLEQTKHLVTHLKAVAQTDAVDFTKFALAIIDWNLLDGEGINIVTKIRAQGISLPIIMLTANTDTEYRKRALEAGVNDFLGKPFYFHELKARVDLLLSSATGMPSSHQTIKNGNIEITKSEMRASYKSQPLTMTKKEFELLLFFVTHPNTVFSRNEILDAVWGEDENPSARTVDTHVLHLRKKLHPELFQTVWSSGYRFLPNGDKSK